MPTILDTEIKYLAGVGPQREKMLRDELGIHTFNDLLQYFPYKYIDRSKIYRIREVTTEMPYIQIKGHIMGFETFKTSPRKERVVAHFTDGESIMDLTWFAGGKYAKTNYKIGKEYIIFGKPNVFNGRINVAQPDVDPAEEMQTQGMGMQPYYSLTEKMRKAGYSSRFIERLVRKLFERLDNIIAISPTDSPSVHPISETLPDFIRNRRNLGSREYALRNIHFPKDAKALEAARVRLKFEELFYVQLNIVRYASDHRRKYRGLVFSRIGEKFNGFFHDYLPFELTGAQKRVIREIRTDVGSGRQMNRLLQGDVGSGKTLVALMSMLIALDNGYQACIMAPTEILAEQHLNTIRQFLGDMDIRVELLTGMVKGKKRQTILSDLALGKVDILVGTHAVIEDTVVFWQLGLVVVDEQHRFGVEQRAKMWTKNTIAPHILVMTATPICRTLAMSIYGDLDYSVIDELPSGRKPILTTHLYDRDVLRLFDFMKKQIEQGRQIYVVYPLIKESEKLDLKDLMDGYESIERAFPLPQYQISIVHGQMKPEDKEYEMQRFKKGITNIMVATTVIEVGVDVPNATVMVIENAERFGLAQLHQLRGRVGRGANQSYCILRTKDELSSEARFRIETMCSTNDGFEISRADLQLRGPGDVSGTRQSGVLDLKVADIVKDEGLMAQVRTLAQNVLADDPHLTKPQNLPIRNYFMTKHKVSDFSMIS